MASDAGVTVTLDASGALKLDAASEPPGHILDLLREHKAELLAELTKTRSRQVLYRRHGDAVMWPHRSASVPGGLPDLFAAAEFLNDEGLGAVLVIEWATA